MTESNAAVLKEIEQQNDTYPQFTFRYTSEYVEYTYKANAKAKEQIKMFTNDQLAHELTYKQKTDVTIVSVLKCNTPRNTPLLVILAKNKYHKAHIYCYDVVTERMHSSIYLSNQISNGSIIANISPEPIELTSNEVSYLLALTGDKKSPFFLVLFKFNENKLRINFSPIVQVAADSSFGKVSAIDISRIVARRDCPYPDVYISTGFNLGKVLVYKVAIQDFDTACIVESPINLTGLVDIDQHPITAVACACTSSDPSELAIVFGQPRVEGRPFPPCYLKIVKVIDSKPPFMMEKVLPYRLESIIQNVTLKPKETGLQLSILYEHDLSYGLNVWDITKDVAKSLFYCETRKRHFFRQFFTHAQLDLQEQVEFYASAPERVIQIMLEQELIRCTYNRKKRSHAVVKEVLKENNKRIKSDSHARTDRLELQPDPTSKNINTSNLNESNHDVNRSNENNQHNQTSEQQDIFTRETIEISTTPASTVESEETQHDKHILNEDIKMAESTFEELSLQSVKIKDCKGINIIETSIETTSVTLDSAELILFVSDEAKETQVSDSLPENEINNAIAADIKDEDQSISLDELDKLMEENNAAPVNDETTPATATDIKKELDEEEENDFMPSSAVNEDKTSFTPSEDEAFDEIMGSDLSELNDSEVSEILSQATVEAALEDATKTEETPEDTSSMDDYVFVEKEIDQQDPAQKVETEQQNLNKAVKTELNEEIVNEQEEPIKEVKIGDLQCIEVETDNSIEAKDNEQQQFIKELEIEQHDIVEKAETEQQQPIEETDSEQQSVSEHVDNDEEQSTEEVKPQLQHPIEEMETEQQQHTKEVKSEPQSIIEGAETEQQEPIHDKEIKDEEEDYLEDMEVDQQDDVRDIIHENHTQNEAMEIEEAKHQTSYQEEEKEQVESRLLKDTQFIEDESMKERSPAPETYFIDDTSEKDSVRSLVSNNELQNEIRRHNEAMESEEPDIQTTEQDQPLEDTHFAVEKENDEPVIERSPVPDTYFTDESNKKESLQNDIVEEIIETDSERYAEETTEHSDSLESERQLTEDSYDEEADFDDIPDYNDPDDEVDSNEYIQDAKDSIPDEDCILLDSTDEEVAAVEDDDEQTTVSADHLGSLQQSFVPAGSATSEETSPKQSTAHTPTIDYIPVLEQELLRFSTDVYPNVPIADSVAQEELSPYVSADVPEENTASFDTILPEEVPSSTVIPKVTSNLNTDVPEESTSSFLSFMSTPNNDITSFTQPETMMPLEPSEPAFTPEQLHKMEIENGKNEATTMISNMLLSLSYHPANVDGLLNGPRLSQEDQDTLGSFAWNETNIYVKFIMLEYCHKHELGKEAMSLCKVLLKEKKNLLEEDVVKLKNLYKIYNVGWKFYYQREVNIFQPSGRKLLREKEMDQYRKPMTPMTPDEIKNHEAYMAYYGWGRGWTK